MRRISPTDRDSIQFAAPDAALLGVSSYSRGSVTAAIVGACCFLLVAVFPVAALGCVKDTDCKGDRVCELSRCVDPTEAMPKARTESTRFWSVDLSGALGIREGSGAQPVVAGTGVMLGFESGSFVGILEFLAPWTILNNLSGIGIGAGGVVRLTHHLDLLLVGMTGIWETMATNGTYEESWGTTGRRLRTEEYIVFYPHLRYGDGIHVSFGPRLGFGETTHYGEIDYSNKAVTITLSTQVGWRF